MRDYYFDLTKSMQDEIMLGFMLDTNVLHSIVENEELVEKIALEVENCKIVLYLTHIQTDEIIKFQIPILKKETDY